MISPHQTKGRATHTPRDGDECCGVGSASSPSPTNPHKNTKGAGSNRPPLNTQPTQIPEQNRIVIDWFEFTLPDSFIIHDRYHCLKSYLNYEGASFQAAPRGMHGYRSQIIYGKARILLDGSEGMGIHVILSGEAIRQIRGNIFKLIDFILYHGGKVSRIDLALDDVTGDLTLLRVKRAVGAGAVTCRSSKYRLMQSGVISTGQVTGETFYFGSSQSRTQYRIYDKAAEQGITGHWVRCEGQYRNENAHQVTQKLVDSGHNLGLIYCGLLRGFLNFLTPSKTDSNKSRWSTAKWWLNLLHNAEKLKLSAPKPVSTLQSKTAWFKKQCAPTFALILQAHGNDVMKEILMDGFARMTPEQKELCSNVNKQ